MIKAIDMPIIIYNILHTMGNSILGGDSGDLTSVGYQVYSDSICTQLPPYPMSKQINTDIIIVNENFIYVALFFNFHITD